jgi:hypothetical protein
MAASNLPVRTALHRGGLGRRRLRWPWQQRDDGPAVRCARKKIPANVVVDLQQAEAKTALVPLSV